MYKSRFKISTAGLLLITQHKLNQLLRQPLRFLQSYRMAALLKDLRRMNLFCDLQDVLLYPRSEEFWRTNGHNRQSQLAALLQQLVVEVPILEASAVRFENSA